MIKLPYILDNRPNNNNIYIYIYILLAATLIMSLYFYCLFSAIVNPPISEITFNLGSNINLHLHYLTKHFSFQKKQQQQLSYTEGWQIIR